MDNYKKNIAEEIARVLDKNKNEVEKTIEIPPSKDLGDYAFPCFHIAKELKKNPNEIARQISEKIKKPEFVRDIKVVGPYVNFFLDESEFAKAVIVRVLTEGKNYGKSKILHGKTIMVEYSAPNTNKPLHVGHLRNDSIGMAISNILCFCGAKVIKANLYSDRGAHICKSMIGYLKYGNNKTPEDENIKGDHFVGKFYVLFSKDLEQNPELEKEAIEMLKKWENKDKEVRELWEKMNSWVIKGFEETYKKFGSKFDVVFKESDFYDKAGSLIEEGLKKKIFKETDVGIVALLEQYGLPNKVLLRKDGTSIYITTDLSLTKYKFDKYKLDEAIWVVGSEQKLYFQQLFKIFELLNYEFAKKCKHLSYEMIYLPEGRLKSREGKVVDADELIESAEEKALEEIKKRYQNITKEHLERKRAIGLAAIKFFMLKVDPNKPIFFDINKAIEFEGETGPYVQYTYARAKSIIRKSGLEKELKNIFKSADFSSLDSIEEKEIISLINEFQQVVEESAKSLAPDKVCQYLLKLSEKFNKFYHSCKIIQSDKVDLEKLLLVYAVSQTIKNGLELLNIETLEEM
ncbi:MAG: arginine--tRNA ligase [Candidatus Diapherotrites archaeon]|nr:arginine--tRNA ligase [Candidatus Diapherotrites archaeon]